MRKTLGLGATLFAALSISCIPAFCADSQSPPETANPANSAECKVTTVGGHACCAESEKVIEILQKLVKAINNGDWDTYMQYMDDHCSTFDENSKKLISGKENVVADMKAKIDKYVHDGHPFISVTIDNPYAKVNGDTAVVTFVAIREYGGKHPFKEECHVTDVFTKESGTWKKLHFRGSWKRA
ncbi:MAG: nuclear transport factor 2 family protein [Candidatus Obscuribacterales bacterium]|nr:nuclear transport factor 2 family protein [Candidatus Obscuribacterales bacterium]